MDQARAEEAVPELIGHFYTWWRGDPLPRLRAVPALTAVPCQDDRLVASLTGLDARAVRDRLQRGHRPWLARIGDEPVGWGWVAACEAEIPELGISFALLPGDRYLWDFMTLPRGGGTTSIPPCCRPSWWRRGQCASGSGTTGTTPPRRAAWRRRASARSAPRTAERTANSCLFRARRPSAPPPPRRRGSGRQPARGQPRCPSRDGRAARAALRRWQARWPAGHWR